MGLIADLGPGAAAVDTAISIYFIEEEPRFLPHILPRKVEDQLIASFAPRTAGNMKAPVRMRTIKFAFDRNHLRLEPQAEGQSLRQGRQAADDVAVRHHGAGLLGHQDRLEA